MNRQQRLDRQARSIRNRVEREDRIVKYSPELKRRVRIIYRHNRASEGSLIFTIDGFDYPRSLKNWVASMRYVHKGLWVVRIEREWTVYANGRAEVYLQNIQLAQAYRDGLNYHYSRWLMTQGTKAEGL